MAQNRNYFTDPTQGNGRSSHDYGRTVLYRDPEPSRWGWWVVGVVVGCLVVGVVAG